MSWEHIFLGFGVDLGARSSGVAAGDGVYFLGLGAGLGFRVSLSIDNGW